MKTRSDNKSPLLRQNKNDNKPSMFKFYIILLLSIFAFEAYAQSHVVRGKVKDDLGDVLGITIAELDKNDRVINGTTTDISGNYVIQVSNPQARLKFSFIGYKAQIIEVNGQSNIDAMMENDATLLAMVNIVSEGKGGASITGISDQNRAGALAKLDMASVDGESFNDASDALQGQIAGMDIISSGSPGESANIVIRGLSTIGDATPLIVVDGIAQESQSGFDFASADADDIGALLSIPTQDIKAISVLKDATECAVWGSRGANGVIVIDTHQGKKGKTSFTYSYAYKFEELPNQMPMLDGNEYIMMQQEQYFNRYGLSTDFSDQIAYDAEYSDFQNYNKNTDWYDLITDNGSVKEHSFKVEGGGDNTSYYISINTYDQDGQVDNEDWKKLNARVNLQFDISKNLKLTTRFTYLNSNKGSNWKYTSTDYDHTPLNLSYIKAPNMAVYEHNSLGEKSDEYFNPIENYQGDGVRFFNPVAVVNLSQNDVVENQLNSVFVLDLKINNYISFQETVSLMNKGQKYSLFLPENAIGAVWNDSNNNQAQEANNVTTTVTTRSLLMLRSPEMGAHRVEGSLMWETYLNTLESMTTKTELSMSSSIIDPGANSIINTIKSENPEIATLGLLGMASYNYKNKYVVTSYLRGDGSSKFGDNNRWGLFPSAGAKWRLKQEGFMQNIRFIGRSDLSVSWGRAGNIPSSLKAYSRHGVYSSGGEYMDETSVVPTQPQLDYLRWETKDELSTGLDLAMLKNNMLTLQLAFYNKKTYYVSWEDYPIPTTSGYSELEQYNGGEIRNRGYEVQLSLRDVIDTKDFNLQLRMNLARNRNWFEALPENQSYEENGGSLKNLTYPLKTQLGSPIGSIFGVRYKGVYASDADAIATNTDGSTKRDANGDPVYMVFQNGDRFYGGDAIYEDINSDGVIDIDDAVYLGNSNAKITGGFGGTLKYKNLQLSTQFVFRYKFDIYNQVAMETESMNNTYNQSKATLYRWRKQGDDFDNIMPRAYKDHQFNTLGSDRFIEDGSYLKLNSLTLSYRLNNDLKKTLGVKDLRISLSGRKLWTWTKYSGQNPEISSTLDDPFWIGTDEGRTPPARTYSITLTVRL